MNDSTLSRVRFGPPRPRSRDSFRILSWNLNRGLEYPKILEFLRTTQADLLLLQEVDLNARRTGFRDIASELAHHLNLNYVFGLEFEELSQGTPGRPAYHGMATLSPWPLSKARTIRFRDQSSFWKPRWYVPNLPAFQRRTGGRTVLVAEATVCKRKVVTYNLHLESRGPDELRLRQLNEVLADCRTYVERPSFVFAGDFNFNAGGGEAAKVLGDAGLRDAVGSSGRPTTTAHGLSHPRAIDWIFVSDPAESQGRVHYEIQASDHYPVSATVVQPCAAA
jgi:endonuclease/exonuclease/phosphatase family metal-dependent hydrolase